MAIKTAVIKEKLFVCEVKRRRVRAAGGYEPFWKLKSVAEAVVDGDTEFRCKDCHGEVKLFKARGESTAPAHVEHKLKSDAEFCSSGLSFQAATDGRAFRMSDMPVR